MGDGTITPPVSMFLDELKVLKSEQTARIGFRDNLLYVTVAAVGGIGAFALRNQNAAAALLLTPWVTTILGWTYLVNDEKISAIGTYLRDQLRTRLNTYTCVPADQILGWEGAHRADNLRMSRKVIQLVVDLIAFVGSGLASIDAYVVRSAPLTASLAAVVAIEALLMLALAWQIILYADLGRPAKSE